MHDAGTKQEVLNGVNVTELHSTIDAITGQPEIAKFQFRAVNRWERGSVNRTMINDYDGACQTFNRKTPFVYQKDEPPVLLGDDSGANPVEYALAALAGCLTTGLVYNAAAQGIRLDKVESTYSGDIDLRGFLNIDPSVRNGYQNVEVTFKVEGDATEEELAALVTTAQERSPVFDIFTNSVPVKVSYVK